MNPSAPAPRSNQGAMALAWGMTMALTALIRYVIEAVQPTELGWGKVVFLMEMIYVTVLGVVLLFFYSIPQQGIRGFQAVLYGILAGCVLPLYFVLSGEPVTAGTLLLGIGPGLYLGLAFAWLRRVR